MNRPKSRNAISKAFLSQLESSINESRDALCVILKSSTPGMFCAGADLKERKDMQPDEVKIFLRDLKRTWLAFESLQCPTITVIDGAALGGGLELALCSDLRIASKDAQIGLTETSLAIIPGAGGTQRLPRLIGESKAKELIFTSERVNG
jgi:methylglutaconyl-CoA hydratase